MYFIKNADDMYMYISRGDEQVYWVAMIMFATQFRSYIDAKRLATHYGGVVLYISN